MTIFHEQFPDTDFSVSAQNIVEGGRTAKLITAQKNPDTPAAWKFIYSRSDEEKQELNEILSEKQKSKK